jgi:hypothetical protein
LRHTSEQKASDHERGLIIPNGPLQWVHLFCMSAPAVAARGQVGTARTMRVAVPAGIQPSHARELSFAEREGHPTCGILAILVIAIDEVFERSFRCVAVVAVEGGAVHGYTPFPSTKQ